MTAHIHSTQDVRIASAEGEISSMAVECTEAEDVPRFTLRASALGTDLLGEGDDLFEAIAALRSQLETQGYKMLVSASRRDAWPTLYDRLHGGGRSVCLLRSSAERDGGYLPVLEAWSPANLEEVASLETQRAYFYKWFSCVGGPSEARVSVARSRPPEAPILDLAPGNDPRGLFVHGCAGWWRFGGDERERAAFFPSVCSLVIQEADGRKRSCDLLVSPALQPSGNIARVVAFGTGCPQRVFSGRDVFAAIGALRRALEVRGARLLCQAAREDVWRQGRSGLSVHLCSPEETPSTELLESLAPAPAELVVDTKTQSDFHQRNLAQHEPEPGETLREQAARLGNGYLHVIVPPFPESQQVPPAIRGSWEVRDGVIVGSFIPNPYYRRRVLPKPVKELDAAMDAKVRGRLIASYEMPPSVYPLDGR